MDFDIGLGEVGVWVWVWGFEGEGRGIGLGLNKNLVLGWILSGFGGFVLIDFRDFMRIDIIFLIFEF